MVDTVYFESNNVAMFNISTSQIIGANTAGTFDSAVVDSCISMPATAFASTSPLPWLGMPTFQTLTTKLYGHFELNCSSYSFIQFGITTPFLQFVNSTGQVIFKVTGIATAFLPDLQCSYWNGSGFTNIGPVFNLGWIGQNIYDFDFTPGTGGSFNLRVNNSSTPVVSVSAFNAATNNVVEARVNNPIQAVSYFSQGVLANFDLRGAKLAVPRISGNGFYTTGTGTYTDINTIPQNQTTGIGLTAVGDRKTFTKPNIATTGMVIQNVSVNLQTAVSGGVVTNVRPLTRRAAADTAGANYATPARGLEQRQLPMYVDPSTGLAWTLANFNATELGVQAQ